MQTTHINGQYYGVEMPEGVVKVYIENGYLYIDHPEGMDYKSLPSGEWEIVGMFNDLDEKELSKVNGFPPGMSKTEVIEDAVHRLIEMKYENSNVLIIKKLN